MKHTVKLADVIIGHSELEHADALEGRAWGRFRPGFGWELVQPVFQLFVEAVPVRGGEPRDHEKLARYHAARDRMNLVLVDAAGSLIDTSALHIADYPGAITLEALIVDQEYWKQRGV